MPERKRQVRWIALIAVTAIALYLCWLMVKPFVGVLGWATVLVICFYPVHKIIERRLKRSSLSALLSCVLVIITILVPVVLLTIAVVRELSGAVQNLQAALAYVTDPNSPVTGRVLRWASQYVNIEELRSQEYLLEQIKAKSGAIAGQTLGLLGGLVGIIVQMIFVIFTMYYLFRDGDKIFTAVRDALPVDRDQATAIMSRTREVIGASVYGVFIIAIIQGMLGGLAFWVLGLPSTIVLGVAMIFLSMIPMLGAFLVWVPAAIYLAITGHPIKAILLVLWGTLVIGMIDNFLRPKLVGERTRLHELLVFFAVLGGLQVFGVLGIVLGPVVLAITMALIDVFKAVDRSAKHQTVES
ncbi:MAG TPA: AI-2E family transporter [Pyrinomonadaceae bacterium]|nr:AI-2E family transporter [Pyrinomonadaceae bacterium]